MNMAFLSKVSVFEELLTPPMSLFKVYVSFHLSFPKSWTKNETN